MNRIMKSTKFIKGKRQLPNLRRILMKSEFNENNTPPCVSKCNEPRCGLCKSIIEGSYLKIKDKTFHVKNMNCTVRNVLYVLISNGCKEYYIGQTGDKLRNRKTAHEQQIRDPSTRPKNREVFGILKANINIFKQDNTMNRIMKNTKFIKGKRQLQNLRRILMKSEFNENNTPPCVSKCNEPRCVLCQSIIEGSCLKLKDKTFHVKKYELHCKKCSLCINKQWL